MESTQQKQAKIITRDKVDRAMKLNMRQQNKSMIIAAIEAIEKGKEFHNII